MRAMIIIIALLMLYLNNSIGALIQAMILITGEYIKELNTELYYHAIIILLIHVLNCTIIGIIYVNDFVSNLTLILIMSLHFLFTVMIETE